MQVTATPIMSSEQALYEMTTNVGRSVADLSMEKGVLLVFLRHFGCTFCREALADIAKQRSSFEALGVEVVLVHMTTDDVAEKYFQKYKLEGVTNVSDPTCKYYTAFGLLKGNFHQLFGLHSWIRGFEAGVVQGHWVGYQQLGDGFQMPGVFSIQQGKIIDQFVHKLASDKPDYEKMIACCSNPD